MNLTIYGNDKRCLWAEKFLASTDAQGFSQVILLPTPTTRDGTHITDTGVELEYIFSNLGKGAIVFGYEIPHRLCDIAKDLGAEVYDLSCDEELLTENARLTALGALGKILTGDGLDPDDVKIGIIGFGRIGKELAKMLTFHGAKLIIFTSKPRCAEELRSVGICGALTANLSDGDGAKMLGGLDLLINTAPAKIISEDMAAYLSDTKVIELATGKNLPDSINYERLPGIPGKMYPKSAGRILAKRIERRLEAYERTLRL